MRARVGQAEQGTLIAQQAGQRFGVVVGHHDPEAGLEVVIERYVAQHVERVDAALGGQRENVQDRQQPDGYQYSAFCDHYRRWRQKLSLSMRQTHTPGEKLFLDYAGQTVGVIDGSTSECSLLAGISSPRSKSQESGN